MSPVPSTDIYSKIKKIYIKAYIILVQSFLYEKMTTAILTLTNLTEFDTF